MYSLIDLIEQYGCFVSRLDLAVCIGASAGEKKASWWDSLPIVELALAMGLTFAKTSSAFSFNNLKKPDITCSNSQYEN
jgi:hypothetical protein